MSGPHNREPENFRCAGAIGQFKGVMHSAAGVVKQADAAGVQIIGVCQETISAADATAGRVTAIQTGGVARCKAGAAIAVNAEVQVDADGDFITALATDWVVGIARTAAGADGDVFDMKVFGEHGYIKA